MKKHTMRYMRQFANNFTGLLPNPRSRHSAENRVVGVKPFPEGYLGKRFYRMEKTETMVRPTGKSFDDLCARRLLNDAMGDNERPESTVTHVWKSTGSAKRQKNIRGPHNSQYVRRGDCSIKPTLRGARISPPIPNMA